MSEPRLRRARSLELPRMSITNVNKLITIVASIFDWSIANFDGFDRNPFIKATIPNRSIARDERDPFTNMNSWPFFLPRSLRGVDRNQPGKRQDTSCFATAQNFGCPFWVSTPEPD